VTYHEGDPDTPKHIEQLRNRFAAEAGTVMIFLGAGLSFGVGRQLGRGSFETPPPIADDARFPSWPILVDRMGNALRERASSDAEREAYKRFMAHEDPLDAVQLFRLVVGEGDYFDFLDRQFETRDSDVDLLTASHAALVALPVRELFTTNYDRLIELSYQRAGQPLAVSATPERFLATKVGQPERHLVKLHGSYEEHDTIVLTRDDYARSRLDRAEMFRELAREARFSTFLFVGFSLRDPNFNLIRDEARMAMGDKLPASYLVQEQKRIDQVTKTYLGSLGVEVVQLFNWNYLPAFLSDINPSAKDSEQA
jgi:SIR2-like domain